MGFISIFHLNILYAYVILIYVILPNLPHQVQHTRINCLMVAVVLGENPDLF